MSDLRANVELGRIEEWTGETWIEFVPTFPRNGSLALAVISTLALLAWVRPMFSLLEDSFILTALGRWGGPCGLLFVSLVTATLTFIQWTAVDRWRG